ncbi:MAG: hypothetical protein ACRD9Y_21900, partial [Blastocatellia bacterium]
DNWAAVNQLTIEEAQRLPLEERLRILNMLYLAVRSFGWDERLRAENEAVRDRWQRLKERFIGASNNGQETFIP